MHALLRCSLVLALACGGERNAEITPDPQEECGGLEALPLAQTIQLLQERLAVRVPRGTRTDQADERTTRLTLRAGEHRMEMVSVELHLTRPAVGSFADAVRAYDDDDDARTEARPQAHGLDAVAVLRPFEAASDRSFTTSDGTTWEPSADNTSSVASVYTATPDGAVQISSFAISRSLLAQHEGCRALALRIADTLRPGPRRLVTRARVVELEHGVSAELAEGQVLAIDHRGSARVYRIERVTPMDRPAGGILLAFRPPPRRERREPVEMDGTLLGQPVRFGVVDEPEEHLFERSAHVALSDGVWLFVTVSSESSPEEANELVDSLALVLINGR